jgi:hypothetical protein
VDAQIKKLHAANALAAKRTATKMQTGDAAADSSDPEAVEDAALKVKAKSACDHAKDMAAEVAAAGDAEKTAVVKTMAAKMCAKVNAVVQKQIRKLHAANALAVKKMAKKSAIANKLAKEAAAAEEAAVKDGKAKKAAAADKMAKKAAAAEKAAAGGGFRAAQARVEGAAHVSAHKDVKVQEDDAPAKAVGAMPAHVVEELKQGVESVEANEKRNKDEAEKACASAKAKIRDQEGDQSMQARKASIDIAMKFCHEGEESINKQEMQDGKVLGKIIKRTAQKYGLKAVKVGKASHAEDEHLGETPSSSDVSAERKLFDKTLGSEGIHVADKQGLTDAKNEALEKALHAKLGKAKARIDAQLAGQTKKVKAACEKAKNTVLTSNDSATRMAHLHKALKFCKKANAMLAQEKKQDYAVLKKVKNRVTKKFIINAHHKHLRTPAVVAASKKVDLKKEAAKEEGAMSAKVASMCAAMKTKAQAVKAAKREVAVQQATAFCKKARGLLAKQAAMNVAAMKSPAAKALSGHIAAVDLVLAELA